MLHFSPVKRTTPITKGTIENGAGESETFHVLPAEKRSGRVSLRVSAGQHASPPPRPVLRARVCKRHYLQVPSGLPKDLVRHNHCGESRGRGDQTRTPRKTERKPRAGRRPPPEASTSSHARDQVTRRSGWARDPSSSLSHPSATLEGRACDTLQMETEARQGQGDPEPTSAGWAALPRGEGPAPASEPAPPGGAALGMGSARSKQTQRGGRRSPRPGADHREDGPADAGRLPAPAARSAWRSGWGGTTSRLPGLRGCGRRPSAWEATGRRRARLGAQL